MGGVPHRVAFDKRRLARGRLRVADCVSVEVGGTAGDRGRLQRQAAPFDRLALVAGDTGRPVDSGGRRARGDRGGFEAEEVGPVFSCRRRLDRKLVG